VVGALGWESGKAFHGETLLMGAFSWPFSLENDSRLDIEDEDEYPIGICNVCWPSLFRLHTWLDSLRPRYQYTFICMYHINYKLIRNQRHNVVDTLNYSLV